MADVEKNAATESLQHYFSDLVVAIQDPVLAASELYSVNLVSLPVVEKMSLLGLTRSEKNSQLLSAIHSQLATNPSGIERFIQVLNAKLNLQEIAEGIEEKHQGELIKLDQGHFCHMIENGSSCRFTAHARACNVDSLTIAQTFAYARGTVMHVSVYLIMYPSTFYLHLQCIMYNMYSTCTLYNYLPCTHTVSRKWFSLESLFLSKVPA